MKRLKLFEEFVEDLHFEEKFRIEYDKVLDPFPMVMVCRFKRDGSAWSFNLRHDSLMFIDSHDDHLDWDRLRQFIFEEMVHSKSHSFEQKDFYITSEGLDALKEKHLHNMYDSNTCELHISIRDLDILILAVENLFIKAYKKYKTND